MYKIAANPHEASIRLTSAELRGTASAMREIIDGEHIPDWEFKIRLGETREDARRLLTELENALAAMPSDTEG